MVGCAAVNVGSARISLALVLSMLPCGIAASRLVDCPFSTKLEIHFSQTVLP